jgi:hypothetical protein
MFEVAVCITLYIIVMWIEFSPTFLEQMGKVDARKKLGKAMFFFIALGTVLPMMHQSSLGTLLVVMGVQIHPLWQTPMLPLLYLLSAITMGYAVVLFESCLTSSAYRRKIETHMLTPLAKIMLGFLARLSGRARRRPAGARRLPKAFVPSVEALMFWMEMLSFIAPLILIGAESNRRNPARLFLAGVLLMLGGALLRLNGFLIGYDQCRWRRRLAATSRPWPKCWSPPACSPSRFSVTSSSPAASRCCPGKTRRPLTEFREREKMSKRVTIDPITRIEGHLRIDVDVDGGRVKKAWSSGQMWRGVELILLGRDPRDAWAITQRICGVCTTVHAITSVRAVENALQMEVPLNAQYIRNLIILAHSVHDQIVHFYHLSALDWVDVTSALKADPDKAASAGREPLVLAPQQQARDAPRA